MQPKKIAKALLFPHILIMIALVFVSGSSLAYSMAVKGSDSLYAIISYVLSAYTLTVWCIRAPSLVRQFNSFKKENKYAIRWQIDTRLRVNVSLYGTLAFNTVYGLFQLWLGVYHQTFWFSSLGGYYICLAVMRFFLLGHTKRYRAKEKIREELIRYRICGFVLLLMNLMLSLIIFFMVYWGRTFIHHEITTIAMAAYTFTSLTLAIINIVKYRKYESPVYSASTAIGLSSACVSMLTLESTMLTTFGDNTTSPLMQKILLGSSGAAVSVLIIVMAISMIYIGTKKLKEIKRGKNEQ